MGDALSDPMRLSVAVRTGTSTSIEVAACFESATLSCHGQQPKRSTLEKLSSMPFPELARCFAFVLCELSIEQREIRIPKPVTSSPER